MARTETISVYLLKERVKTAEDALRVGSTAAGLESYDIAAADTRGKLFVKQPEASAPDWVGLLGPVASPPLESRGSSPSGLLLLQAAARWFAIAFGHGRTLLDPAIYERDFGLLVALNGVDAAKLRGLEARSFNEHALHTQRQLSRLSTMQDLEIDVQRDLLTALSGQLQRQDLGSRMVGRDAARLTAALTADEIAGKCAEMLALSAKDDYKARFPGIDTIERLRDPDQIAALERRAGEALGQRAFDRFDVFPPELVDEAIMFYELAPGRGHFVEPGPELLGSVITAPMSGPDALAAVRAGASTASTPTGGCCTRGRYGTACTSSTANPTRSGSSIAGSGTG